jgi:molybdate transport system ATP-binding protein
VTPGSSSPSRSFLSLDNVSLRLHDRVVFQNTNWHVLHNDHWAVIGGNGAGKSILMRALCGQIPVISGRILYRFPAGESRSPGELAQGQVAYVSFGDQKRTLERNDPYYQARWNRGVGEARLCVADHLSERNVRHINPYQVLENPPDPNAFAEQRERVVGLLGIENLLTKELVQLSDGERRKISIAKALMQRPNLLILDNPLTGLDAAFREKLMGIIEQLMRDAMRVIIATTRQDEIPSGVTDVLLIRDCQVIAQGSRTKVLNGKAAHLLSQPPAQTRALRLPSSYKPAKARPAPTILVRMSRINVAYGATPILENVEWMVRRGEHWALLGANGAGKTTLLSLILGDHPQAYANDVWLFEQKRGSGESIWEIKQRIGWVAPELHLYHPHGVSGLQVVCSGLYDSVGLYHHCSARQRQTAREWMRHLGIEGFAEASFADLSEGEQRLVLLARALVKRPLLLVLDEPCQGLDATNRAWVRRTVEAVGEQSDTSVIYVTHNPAELPQIITHRLVLDRGRVIERGRLGDRAQAPDCHRATDYPSSAAGAPDQETAST